MKSIVTFVASGALLISVITPAFAGYSRDGYNRHHQPRPEPQKITVHNDADIDADITTIADSGHNFQLVNPDIDNHTVQPGWSFHHWLKTDSELKVNGTNEMRTGYADSLANNTIKANLGETVDLKDLGYRPGGLLYNLINDADVDVNITTKANSGHNIQVNTADVDNHRSGDVTVSGYNGMSTGDAVTTTNSTIIVNSSWSNM